MPILTPQQELNLSVTKFEQLLKEIRPIFFKALIFSQEHNQEKSAHHNGFFMEAVAKLRPQLTFTRQESRNQRELLKNLLELKLAIESEHPDHDVFNTPIRTNMDTVGGMLINTVIDKQMVTAQYAMDVLMPKILLLQYIDTLLLPVLHKLKDLEKKVEAEPWNQKDKKYARAYTVVLEIVKAADDARKLLVGSDDIEASLQAIQSSLSAVYTENNLAILAEHRDNATLNAALDMLNQCIGYVMMVLTYPNRYLDDSGTQAYVDGWFKPRSTQSLHILSLFKEKIEDPLMRAEAGLTMPPVLG
tara:strand:- start:14565 stop:15473 length:909 start_codon:yes stop_codon:yes gene_type:complete